MDEIIEKLKIMTNEVGDKTFLMLWHGTSKSNHTKILKTGKFKVNTYFTNDESIARRYSQMTGSNKPMAMYVSIDADGLYFDGSYFIAKKDLFFKNCNYS